MPGGAGAGCPRQPAGQSAPGGSLPGSRRGSRRPGSRPRHPCV